MISNKPRSTMEVIMEIRFHVMKARAEAEVLAKMEPEHAGPTETFIEGINQVVSDYNRDVLDKLFRRDLIW